MKPRARSSATGFAREYAPETPAIRDDLLAIRQLAKPLDGALFGPVWGTLWNLLGATLGAVAAFLLARTLAGPWACRPRLASCPVCSAGSACNNQAGWLDGPELKGRLAAGDPLLLIDVDHPEEFAAPQTIFPAR